MPAGSKNKYTAKQKRRANHIEESYEQRGVSPKTARQRAWQTVNKQSGGGEKSGGGRNVPAKASGFSLFVLTRKVAPPSASFGAFRKGIYAVGVMGSRILR